MTATRPLRTDPQDVSQKPLQTSGLEHRDRFRKYLTLALIAIIGFGINYSLELKFYRLKVFDQYNVLFDADPNEGMAALVDASQGRGYKHPDFAYFLHPSVRYAAKAVAKLHVTARTEGELRRDIALLVVPALSAIKSIVLLLFFVEVGLSLPYAALMCLIDLTSLSRLVFGSIPETFAVSGLAIALLYLLAAKEVRPYSFQRQVLWVIAGTFAIGITITNLMAMAVLLFSSNFYMKRDWLDSLKTTSKLTAAAFAAAVSIALLLGTVSHWKVEQLYNTYTDDSFYRIKLAETSKEFPAGVTHTFIAPLPNIVANDWPGWHFRYPFQFTYAEPAADRGKEMLFELLVLSLIGLGCVGHWKYGEPRQRSLLIGSLLVLAVNFGLHCLYGSSDLFLYSQHWSLAALFLLAGGLYFKGSAGRIAAMSLIVLPIVLIVNNIGVLRYVLGYLRAH